MSPSHSSQWFFLILFYLVFSVVLFFYSLKYVHIIHSGFYCDQIKVYHTKWINSLSMYVVNSQQMHACPLVQLSVRTSLSFEMFGRSSAVRAAWSLSADTVDKRHKWPTSGCDFSARKSRCLSAKKLSETPLVAPEQVVAFIQYHLP